MAVYLLEYDLVKETSSHDYEPLWAALKAAGAHRTQLSAWLVASTSGAKQVHDHFQKYLDSNDRLWVAKVHKNTSSDEYWFSNAKGGTNDWLKKNPPQ